MMPKTTHKHDSLNSLQIRQDSYTYWVERDGKVNRLTVNIVNIQSLENIIVLGLVRIFFRSSRTERVNYHESEAIPQ